MSQMSYDGITIPYLMTTEFAQSAVYDDSNTDRYLNKFDIKVQGVISTDYINLLDPGNTLANSGNPADLMDEIRTKLLTPRKKLTFTINGVDLIPNIDAQVAPVDARNGPLPQTCSLVRLTNSSFLITYHVIAHFFENNRIIAGDPDGQVVNTPSNSILNNRWTETVDIDNTNFSTYTREGKFVISSNNLNSNIADELRAQAALLALEDGFIRESSRYSLSTDGLTMTYRIVDKEQFKMPPFPAFEAEGEYYESSPLRGPLRYMEVRVRLKGSKMATGARGNLPTQSQLLIAALTIASAKVAAANQALAPGTSVISLIQSVAIKVGLYDNHVEVNHKATIRATRRRVAGANIAGSDTADSVRITFTPLSDGVVRTADNMPYPLRGSAGLLLQAAAYYDPSFADTHLDLGSGQLTRGQQPGKAGFSGE